MEIMLIGAISTLLVGLIIVDISNEAFFINDFEEDEDEFHIEDVLYIDNTEGE